MREKGQMIPAFERIQKSNSVVEVVPVRKLTADITSAPSQYLKETSPYLQTSHEDTSAFKPTLEGSAFKAAEPAAKELSPSMTTNTVPTTTFSNNLSSPDRGPHDLSSSFSSECLQGKCLTFVVKCSKIDVSSSDKPTRLRGSNYARHIP